VRGIENIRVPFTTTRSLFVKNLRQHLVAQK